MKRVALIPARMDSLRFPGKLIKDLGGKPVIVRTYENAVNTGLFDEVIVVTNSDSIETAVHAVQGKVIRSRGSHPSGTDRIAEAAAKLPEAAVIVNVQGDEPFIAAAALKSLLDVFETEEGKDIQVASLMHLITTPGEVDNPNHVKVVTDTQNFALYFSRNRIPYPRDPEKEVPYFRHMGIYAFRRTALLNFPKRTSSPLEAIEKLEQLRFLENGISIKMVLTPHSSLGIDTPEDLEIARKKI